MRWTDSKEMWPNKSFWCELHSCLRGSSPSPHLARPPARSLAHIHKWIRIDQEVGLNFLRQIVQGPGYL